MSKIFLNGKQTEIKDSHSLLTALAEWGYRSGAFAVALNQTFIPKKNYANIFLKDGDKVEIVAPMQGG